MTDSFDCYRRLSCMREGSSFVVLARKRDYVNGENTLRDIILKDELPCGNTPDRGLWLAQGIANVSGYVVFLYIEHAEGAFCGPIFPIDDGPFEYMEEERGEVEADYPAHIEEMRKEGRWQGDRNHALYPWRKE